MDDRLHKQIASWLEFYRDLGIETFYRRESTTVSADDEPRKSLPRISATETRTAERAAQPPRASDLPTPTRAAPPPAPSVLSPPAQSLSLFEAPPSVRREPETLDEIRQDLGDCQRCRLAAGRKTIVFGQGNPHAELVFVGEGPGADEDEQGLPFVGRAGKLLNRMIQFIGMKREEVYICNIVKCRPPGNRTPEKDEVDTCSPFLFRQLAAIQPR
ncbi:MAG: uracil-DNA glycosylase, partial [Acidobacteria bacterium]|nr:uracil-DNA glycosylase [Acidobacteriota bacterium]